MAENAKGGLFKNDRKTGSQPDYTGNIELTPELLKELLAEAEKGSPYKARLAAWIKTGRKGTFLSVSLNAPFSKGGAPMGRPRQDDDAPF